MVDQPTSVRHPTGFMPEEREDVIAAGALIWSEPACVSRARRAATSATHHPSEHDILDGIAMAMVDRKAMRVPASVGW